MFRQLNRQTQLQFSNHQWGDDKSNRVIDIVTKHIQIINQILKSQHPSLNQICTNAKHLLIQLKYNISYTKKNPDVTLQQPVSKSPDPVPTTEAIVNELEKMRRLSVNRFLNEFHEKQSKKQQQMPMMVPGSLNYHLKFQNKEIQTNLLECEIETALNKIQSYELEIKMLTDFNETLKNQNEQRKLELLSVNKSLMGILMQKAILQAQYTKVKQLKPSIVQKIVIDYSQIQKRVNQGYQSIIQKVIKYSANNIFTKENNYSSAPVGTKRRQLKCGTTLNMMVLPKSKENLDYLNQYYSNFQKNSLSLSQTENLIKSLETKEQKIYELERKLAMREKQERDNSLNILKERAEKKGGKGKMMGMVDEKEVQTKIVFGVGKFLTTEQIRKIVYYQGGDGQGEEGYGWMGENMYTQTGEEGDGEYRMGKEISEEEQRRAFDGLKQVEGSEVYEEVVENGVIIRKIVKKRGSKCLRNSNLRKSSEDPLNIQQQNGSQIVGNQGKRRFSKSKKQPDTTNRKKSIGKAGNVGGSPINNSSKDPNKTSNRRSSKKQQQQNLINLSQLETKQALQRKKKQQNKNINSLDLPTRQNQSLLSEQFRQKDGRSTSKSRYAHLKENIDELESRTKDIHNEMSESQQEAQTNEFLRNTSGINYGNTKKIKKKTQESFKQQQHQHQSNYKNQGNNNRQSYYDDESENNVTVRILQEKQSGNQENPDKKYRNFQKLKGQKAIYQLDKLSNSNKDNNRYLSNHKKYRIQNQQNNENPIRNRISRSKNSSVYNSKQFYQQNLTNTNNNTNNSNGISNGNSNFQENSQADRKRIESLPILQQSKEYQNLRNSPSILPKLSKCHHQHHISHDKLIHLQSKKIQQKIQKLQQQIEKSVKGRANNSRMQLQKYVKLLQSLHKTCGSDCKYLQRAWQSTYATPQNKRQLKIPKYDMVFDEQEQKKEFL